MTNKASKLVKFLFLSSRTIRTIIIMISENLRSTKDNVALSILYSTDLTFTDEIT